MGGRQAPYSSGDLSGAGRQRGKVGRRDRLNDVILEMPLEAGFVASKYRESRDEDGRLTYVGGNDRLELIRGLPVHNTGTGAMESL